MGSQYFRTANFDEELDRTVTMDHIPRVDKLVSFSVLIQGEPVFFHILDVKWCPLANFNIPFSRAIKNNDLRNVGSGGGALTSWGGKFLAGLNDKYIAKKKFLTADLETSLWSHIVETYHIKEKSGFWKTLREIIRQAQVHYLFPSLVQTSLDEYGEEVADYNLLYIVLGKKLDFDGVAAFVQGEQHNKDIFSLKVGQKNLNDGLKLAKEEIAALQASDKEQKENIESLQVSDKEQKEEISSLQVSDEQQWGTINTIKDNVAKHENKILAITTLMIMFFKFALGMIVLVTALARVVSKLKDDTIKGKRFLFHRITENSAAIEAEKRARINENFYNKLSISNLKKQFSNLKQKAANKFHGD